MAWPFDARHKDYAARTMVQSTSLNEMQDRIKEIYGGGSEWVFLNGSSEKQAASDEPGWLIDAANPEHGWYCLEAGKQLTIPLVFPTRTIITEVKAKVWIAAGGFGLSVRLYKVQHFRGTAATAPTRALVGAGYEAADAGQPDWRVGTVATAQAEVIDPLTDHCHIEIANGSVGDKVAAIFVDT